MHVHMHMHIHIHVNVHVHMHVRMHIHMHVNVHVHMVRQDGRLDLAKFFGNELPVKLEIASGAGEWAGKCFYYTVSVLHSVCTTQCLYYTVSVVVNLV